MEQAYFNHQALTRIQSINSVKCRTTFKLINKDFNNKIVTLIKVKGLYQLITLTLIITVVVGEIYLFYKGMKFGSKIKIRKLNLPEINSKAKKQQGVLSNLNLLSTSHQDLSQDLEE